MSDPFKKFVEEMARLAVPEDDTEDNRDRREAATSKVGDAIERAGSTPTSSPAPMTSSYARRRWRSGRRSARRERWPDGLNHQGDRMRRDFPLPPATGR